MAEVFRNIQDIRDVLKQKRDKNMRIGFVPTMGALHEGHGALIDAAQAECDIVVVSIFVNLKQFAAGEDFETYPRLLEKDLSFLEKRNVDYVFLPSNDEIYPDHFATMIKMSGPAEGLEADIRPHFFHGVATIVMKLFLIVFPDIAYFGEKDYQQLCVVKRCSEDLSMPVVIKGVPTRRESDGLAMSSRNLYLSEAERALAPFLYKALCQVAKDMHRGFDLEASCRKAKEFLLEKGFDKVDYIEIRAEETLEKAEKNTPLRVLAATYLGTTRLIDNIALDETFE